MYPNKLFTVKTTEGGYDDDGFALQPTRETVFVSECREQVNSAGHVTTNNDGEVTQYNAIIFAPLSSPDFTANDEVVIETDGIQHTEKVIRFKRGLLHCRLWV